MSGCQTSAYRGHTSPLQQPSLRFSFRSHSYPDTVHRGEPDCGAVWISTSMLSKERQIQYPEGSDVTSTEDLAFCNCKTELIIWLRITSGKGSQKEKALIS